MMMLTAATNPAPSYLDAADPPLSSGGDQSGKREAHDVSLSGPTPVLPRASVATLLLPLHKLQHASDPVTLVESLLGV